MFKSLSSIDIIKKLTYPERLVLVTPKNYWLFYYYYDKYNEYELNREITYQDEESVYEDPQKTYFDIKNENVIKYRAKPEQLNSPKYSLPKRKEIYNIEKIEEPVDILPKKSKEFIRLMGDLYKSPRIISNPIFTPTTPENSPKKPSIYQYFGNEYTPMLPKSVPKIGKSKLRKMVIVNEDDYIPEQSIINNDEIGDGLKGGDLKFEHKDNPYNIVNFLIHFEQGENNKGQKYGHWVGLWLNNVNKRCYYFDSYGEYMDYSRKNIDDYYLKKTGQNEKVIGKFMYFLLTQGYKCEYNEIPYQKLDGKTATCGRYIISFFNYFNYYPTKNMKNFQNYLKQKSKLFKEDYDKTIYILTQ